MGNGWFDWDETEAEREAQLERDLDCAEDAGCPYAFADFEQRAAEAEAEAEAAALVDLEAAHREWLADDAAVVADAKDACYGFGKVVDGKRLTEAEVVARHGEAGDFCAWVLLQCSKGEVVMGYHHCPEYEDDAGWYALD